MRSAGAFRPGTRPEEKLLLCCARSRTGADADRQIRELVQSGIDWGYLLPLARRHGMTPLLSHHLDRLVPDSVPKPYRHWLDEAFRQINRNNLFLTRELLHILDRCHAEGVPALPLKGSVLAVSLYGDVALRQCSDLDLLVCKRDMRRARQALASLGYRPRLPITRGQEHALMHSAHDDVFDRPGIPLRVEIHWRLTPGYFSFPLAPEWLWQRVNHTDLGGRAVPALPPEELLLFLCAHGTKHLWERLLWICDVAELIRVYPDMNWQHVTELARSLGSERMLLLGLHLAHDLLGIHLPEPLHRRACADTRVRALGAYVLTRLFQPAPEPPELLESARFHLQARERARDRARYCLLLVAAPTTGDLACLPLPACLSPWGYYLLRPMRLALKYGWRRLSRVKSWFAWQRRRSVGLP